MTTTDARPIHQAPAGFEYRLTGNNRVHLVDVRPRLDPATRLHEFDANVEDDTFDKIMLRRDENQQLILGLPEWLAIEIAQLAIFESDFNPYGFLLNLTPGDLDWVIHKFRERENSRKPETYFDLDTKEVKDL